MYILIWIMCGIIAAMIGSKKGEGILSFFAGMIFGPIGIIFAILSKGNRKECRWCKELIKKEATTCPRCGKEQ